MDTGYQWVEIFCTLVSIGFGHLFNALNYGTQSNRRDDPSCHLEEDAENHIDRITIITIMR